MMADFRITDLQVQTQLIEDSWVATDNTTTGYRRFNLKSVSDAASAANTAATAAMAAKTAADAAAEDAAEAATSAESRIDAAIDAIGDISELAVPLMSSDIRGGAKLGDGLAVDDGTLHVGQLAKESTGEVYGPLASVTAKGHAEQFSTTGKNLLPNTATSQTKNGVTFTVNADGSISISGTASAFTEFRINATAIVPADGTYTLSGAHSGNCYLRAWGDNANSVIIDDFGDGASFPFSAATKVNITAFINVRTNATVNDVIYPMIEAGSSKTEYEPYTGAAPSPSPDYPQEIQVVRGRNLIDKDNAIILNAYHNANGGIISNADNRMLIVPVKPNTTYCLSGNRVPIGTASDDFTSYQYSSLPAVGTTAAISSLGVILNASFTTAPNAEYIAMKFANTTKTDPVATLATLQLTLGSTPQPYVPYGYVGLEVRQNGDVISTTPIPLPQRGWVGSLPDGTADELTIDPAGKVTWTLPTKMRDLGELTWSKWAYNNAFFTYGITDAMENIDSSLCTSFRAIEHGKQASISDGEMVFSGATFYVLDSSKTEMAASQFKTAIAGQTLLYPLATPVTEDCGYVENWPVHVSGSATVSIPELSDFGCTYWVDDDGTISIALGAWYKRAYSEYESRLTALESAVATLTVNS